ncbi:hypothetical protein PV392_10475 [Streptomyces sp. ME03-5709C]|nr:hypothetical protein [Streptomyces sp. ME03-5709C]
MVKPDRISPYSYAVEGWGPVKRLLWTVCGGTALLVLLAGCGDSHPESSPDRTASPAASTDRVDPGSSRAAVAQDVKSSLEERLGPDEARFGSGTGSPCSTSSARMFTAECGSAAEAAGVDASFALQLIERREGFAALRSVAERLRAAAARYQKLGCADNATGASTRHACLEPAALIAQGFPDLRGGANLGLRGA